LMGAGGLIGVPACRPLDMPGGGSAIWSGASGSIAIGARHAPVSSSSGRVIPEVPLAFALLPPSVAHAAAGYASSVEHSHHSMNNSRGQGGRTLPPALELQMLSRGLLGPDLARAAAMAQSLGASAGRAGITVEGHARGLLVSSQPLFRPSELAPGSSRGVRGGALAPTGGGTGARGHVATDSLTAHLQLVVL